MRLFSWRLITWRFAIVLAVGAVLCAGALEPERLDAASSASTEADRLSRVEAIAVELPGLGGEAPLRLSLADLMKTYNVPGLSIAVIVNFKIVDAKAYGVIEPGSRTPVTTRTLFQ